MADDPDEDPAGSDSTAPASSSQDEQADGSSNAEDDTTGASGDERADEDPAEDAADEAEESEDAADDSDEGPAEDAADETEELADDADVDADADAKDTDADAEDEGSEEVPRLDGSDVDDSGGLTKLDGSDGGGGDTGGFGGGSGDDSAGTPPGAPPAEPTGPSGHSDEFDGDTTPPGVPPSEPTRSRPDASTADRSTTDEERDGSDADELASDEAADSSADTTGPEPGGDPDAVAGATDGNQPGCEAAPPDDFDGGDLSDGTGLNSADPAPATPPGADPTPAGSSGGGTTGGAGATAEDEGVFSGPPDDEEMPLTEHINEMVGRLAAVAIIAAGVAVFSYPFSGDIITWMWYTVHPGSAASCVPEPLNPAHGCAPPHVYGPLEFILTKLKFSGLVGLVVAIPFAVYQTYLFMKPGLYPSERRYYLASVPLSLVLALMGISFAFVVILPLLFEYFLEYTAETVDVAFQLADTIDLMLVLMGWTALTFQIPLLMSLAVMMGIVSRRWMKRKRIYFWGGFGAVGFFFVGADPTGMASVLLTITMILLFEVTLLLLRWTGR